MKILSPSFFTYTANTEIYTLSLHDALPISWPSTSGSRRSASRSRSPRSSSRAWPRSEEHTSELQSPYDLVCRLLLEKKKHVVSHRFSNARKQQDEWRFPSRDYGSREEMVTH